MTNTCFEYEMTAPSLVREYLPDGGRRIQYMLYILGVTLRGWKGRGTLLISLPSAPRMHNSRMIRPVEKGAVGMMVSQCVRACLGTHVWTSQLSSVATPLLAPEHELHDMVAKTHFDNCYGKPEQLNKRASQANRCRAAFSVTLPCLGVKAPLSTSNFTSTTDSQMGCKGP